MYAACIIAGCIVVPLPPGLGVYITEYDVRELQDKSASKEEVIEILGRPARQYKSDISYRACRKGAGVFWTLLIPISTAGGGGVHRSETECFELILHFDSNNCLTSYAKYPFDPPFSHNFKTPDGDALPTIKLMAENGFPESQWRLYAEYGKKPEDITWLCRSADNGYAEAQLHVGSLYWSASSIPNNRIKAYIWYKLAATGVMFQGLMPDVKAQSRATQDLLFAKNALTPEQLAEAEMSYTTWSKGQCEKDLLLLSDSNS
jgi:hypothetical protein